jgi:hypothetical protein
MFLALGAGAYAGGLFHLVAHAYIKSMLFLCSGEYSGTITLSQDSNWGIKFYIKDDWTGAYGGSNGKLYYNSNDGIPLTAGTYTITVNLIDGTYSASNK